MSARSSGFCIFTQHPGDTYLRNTIQLDGQQKHSQSQETTLPVHTHFCGPTKSTEQVQSKYAVVKREGRREMLPGVTKSEWGQLGSPQKSGRFLWNGKPKNGHLDEEIKAQEVKLTIQTLIVKEYMYIASKEGMAQNPGIPVYTTCPVYMKWMFCFNIDVLVASK